jgi:hypothetical protein
MKLHFYFMVFFPIARDVPLSLLSLVCYLFNYLFTFLNYVDIWSPLPLYFSHCLEILWSWVIAIDTASALMELRLYPFFFYFTKGRSGVNSQSQLFLHCDIDTCWNSQTTHYWLCLYAISNMFLKLLYTQLRFTCLF